MTAAVEVHYGIRRHVAEATSDGDALNTVNCRTATYDSCGPYRSPRLRPAMRCSEEPGRSSKLLNQSGAELLAADGRSLL